MMLIDDDDNYAEGCIRVRLQRFAETALCIGCLAFYPKKTHQMIQNSRCITAFWDKFKWSEL